MKEWTKVKISPNIGILNALIRITCGLTFLSWAAARYSKKPWCKSYLVVIMLSAMKVAEGIVRYCPITEGLKKAQTSMNQLPFQMNQNENNQMGQNKNKQNQNSTNNSNGNELDLMDEVKKFQQNLDD